MTTNRPLLNAMNPPLPQGEGLGVRFKPAISTKSAVEMMKLIKRQIEVLIFACGARKILELSNGKLSKGVSQFMAAPIYRTPD